MKLKIVKCDKFVNEEKGIVVTKITDNMGNKFEAKATCLPEDTFDEETGSRLSYLKAKKKMYARYERAYEQQIQNTTRIINRLNSIRNDLYGAVNKLEHKIKDISE